MRDALIFAENIEVTPLGNDMEFFQHHEVRTTRYRLTLPQLFIQGNTILGLLQGKKCEADYIRMPNLTLDMLVDSSKRRQEDTSSKNSPSLLTSLQSQIQLDSIGIDNARIRYMVMNTQIDSNSSGYAIHTKGLRASMRDTSIRTSSIEVQLLPKNDASTFRCGEFRASIRDSSLLIRDASYLPDLDVDEYFKADNYRRTRLTLQVPQLRAKGISYLGLIKGESYKARVIEIQKPVFGIQVSVFKQNKRPIPKSLMPNEIMRDITSVIRIDSVHAIDAMMLYEEHYKPSSKPAYISFHHVNVAINSLTNYRHDGDTADVHFTAEFMDGGSMNMNMKLPVTSPKFTAIVSGTLGKTKLPNLNTFLEIAENVRIKSGVCQSASVSMKITDGKALGSIRILYKDFNLAFLDKKSKSSKGIFNILKSFLANTFTFKSSNEKTVMGL
ncbi:MAG: hypothetical protein IPM69_12620 [Ignavibacteria bacterium]|nr:hypothetical protein [Ignavibacteria bacterium]